MRLCVKIRHYLRRNAMIGDYRTAQIVIGADNRIRFFGGGGRIGIAT
jgi:hypothetical protein